MLYRKYGCFLWKNFVKLVVYFVRNGFYILNSVVKVIKYLKDNF